MSSKNNPTFLEMLEAKGAELPRDAMGRVTLAQFEIPKDRIDGNGNPVVGPQNFTNGNYRLQPEIIAQIEKAGQRVIDLAAANNIRLEDTAEFGKGDVNKEGVRSAMKIGMVMYANALRTYFKGADLVSVEPGEITGESLNELARNEKAQKSALKIAEHLLGDNKLGYQDTTSAEADRQLVQDVRGKKPSLSAAK